MIHLAGNGGIVCDGDRHRLNKVTAMSARVNMRSIESGARTLTDCGDNNCPGSVLVPAPSEVLQEGWELVQELVTAEMLEAELVAQLGLKVVETWWEEKKLGKGYLQFWRRHLTLVNRI